MDEIEKVLGQGVFPKIKDWKTTGKNETPHASQKIKLDFFAIFPRQKKIMKKK